jgi:ornithine cyclodeaminase/alanine dehydrogenase-like protein (mu-crystallin family)
MLVLNENDILQAITMKELIEAIEEAYVLYDSNNYQMPLRIQIADEDNTLLLMPCVARCSTGVKIVSVFPRNREQPVTQGVVVLNDRNNGTTKGILNGTVLTGLRTGAVSGAAIKYLAPEDCHSVGLIGTGFQGLYQLLSACAVREIDHIYLFNRTPSKLFSFVQSLKKHLTKVVEIQIIEDVMELVEKSEVVITSTTSHSPVLPESDTVFNGKLIIGIGSYQPQMREFSESVYRNIENLYIDTLDAFHESGDIIDPIQNQWIDKSQVISFSKVITGKVKPILSEHRPSVFKSTGMALFDLVAANVIYEKAVQLNLGQNVQL